tara:strand:- start:146 stop:331 length:186 start_codon:yes stop_codon:yes gene_type:complete
MSDERSVYEAALKQLRAGRTFDPQVCMDFLDGLGYYVGALGNEEIVQLTEDVLSEMDQEGD